MHLSPSHLSKIERGDVQYTQERLEQIAHALNVETADLLRPPPTGEEAELIDLLRHLKPDQRRAALRVLKALAAEDERAA